MQHAKKKKTQIESKIILSIKSIMNKISVQREVRLIAEAIERIEKKFNFIIEVKISDFDNLQVSGNQCEHYFWTNNTYLFSAEITDKETNQIRIVNLREFISLIDDFGELDNIADCLDFVHSISDSYKESLITFITL